MISFTANKLISITRDNIIKKVDSSNDVINNINLTDKANIINKANTKIF